MDHHKKDRWMMNFIIFVLYPGIGTRIFRLFRCQVVGNSSYLVADYSIKCWQGDHLSAVYVAIILILIYVIGIPAATVYVLYNRKTSLNEENTARV